MSLIEPLTRKIRLMIGRCVIAAAKADGGRVLVDVEVLEGEVSGAVEWAEPTGLTCVPVEGAEGVTLAVMGDRGHRLVMAVGDRRHRPRDLGPGEASLFDCAGEGNRIDVLKDRIRIIAPTRLEIITPFATINGDAISTVGDRVNVQGGSSAGLHPLVEGVGVNV